MTVHICDNVYFSSKSLARVNQLVSNSGLVFGWPKSADLGPCFKNTRTTSAQPTCTTSFWTPMRFLKLLAARTLPGGACLFWILIGSGGPRFIENSDICMHLHGFGGGVGGLAAPESLKIYGFPYIFIVWADSLKLDGFPCICIVSAVGWAALAAQ